MNLYMLSLMVLLIITNNDIQKFIETFREFCFKKLDIIIFQFFSTGGILNELKNKIISKTNGNSSLELSLISTVYNIITKKALNYFLNKIRSMYTYIKDLL